MQVDVHQLEHKVQITVVMCPNYPLEFNNVLVSELPQDGHLSVGALGIYLVLKGIKYLLEGVLPS